MGANFSRAARIASRQNGRITTEQLRGCAFGAKSIERAVQAGRLHRVHQGVYAVGHQAPSRRADWHAAVLACGPDAVLSHRSAATAWGIRDGVGPRIDVTIPSSRRRRRPGIDVHRSDLLPFEIGVWRDIPIATPARTMVDLAHVLKDQPEGIEWAMRQMQFQRLFDTKLLEISHRRRPNATVSRLLTAIEPTRSPLEVAFLHRVVHRHHLPAPEVNTRVLGYLVDFHWPVAGLIVETDGKQHDQPLQRAADAHRDAVHAAAGLTVLRFRWPDVHRHDARTARQIWRALEINAPMRREMLLSY
jgi:very-short-patch-repair endonuclease/predicted transcriptional regulator of viral defense system